MEGKECQNYEKLMNHFWKRKKCYFLEEEENLKRFLQIDKICYFPVALRTF